MPDYRVFIEDDRAGMHINVRAKKKVDESAVITAFQVAESEKEFAEALGALKIELLGFGREA